MPYSNVPEADWGKMDRCVEDVMAKDASLEKPNAIAICHESVVGKEEKQHGGMHSGHGGAHGEGGKPSPKRRNAREEFSTVNRRLAEGNLKPGEQASLERRAEQAAREILQVAPDDEGGATQTLDEIEAMLREDMNTGKEYRDKSFLEALVDGILAPFTAKAGARHSKPDNEALQIIHDKTTELGASCPMMVFKEASGKYRWALFSSTAYQDRDGEIVSTKAQEADCAELDQSGDYGVLRWWHVGQPYAEKSTDYKTWKAGKGLDLGVCDFSEMHGRIRIESGTFHINEIGARFKEIADQISVSLGFSHPDNQPSEMGGVFENIHTFERSLLPAGKQSNYFASIPIIEKESKMNDSKIKKFKELMGEFAELALGKAEQTDKAAEIAGVAFKEEEKKPFAFGSEADLKAFVVKLMDEYMGGKGKESKEANETNETTSKELGAVNTALESLQVSRKGLEDNDAKIAAALNELAKIEQANVKAIKELQGDLPRSLKSLRRTEAEDNVIDKATAEKSAPMLQDENGFGSWLDYAVTGANKVAAPPAG